MIFELKDAYQKDNFFSWKISKNPDGIPFEREFGADRKVFGTFAGNNHTYNCYVENDDLLTIQALRSRNVSSYLFI